MTSILGISAFYHDSAACILKDGEILAAAQEERFTRIKNAPLALPINSIFFCLNEAKITIKEIKKISFELDIFFKGKLLIKSLPK